MEEVQNAQQERPQQEERPQMAAPQLPRRNLGFGGAMNYVSQGIEMRREAWDEGDSVYRDLSAAESRGNAPALYRRHGVKRRDGSMAPTPYRASAMDLFAGDWMVV